MAPISKFEFDEMQRRIDASKSRKRGITACHVKDVNAVDKEHVLHGQIVEEVKARGWLAFYNFWGEKSNRPAGEQDFEIFAPNGRTILMEAKTKTGKLTMEQAANACHLAKLGHVVFTVRSIEHVRQIFDNPMAGLDNERQGN